jgi:O-antigen ligase
VILATASRGALVAIAVGFIYAMFIASTRQRIGMLIVACTMMLAVISFLPLRTWQRLLSFSEANEISEASAEALLSSQSREYLLRKSLIFTVEHPIFGVGAGQFSGYEGKTSRQQGQLGMWHETHNAYTQIASENGLPAFFLYIAGIGSSMILLHRVYKTGKSRPEFREISTTAFCLLLSLVSFSAAIFFLNFGYFFYLPAMAGLAISVSCAAEVEFQKAAGAAPANSPAPANTGLYGWLPQRIVPRPIPQVAPLGRPTRLQ